MGVVGWRVHCISNVKTYQRLHIKTTSRVCLNHFYILTTTTTTSTTTQNIGDYQPWPPSLYKLQQGKHSLQLSKILAPGSRIHIFLKTSLKLNINIFISDEDPILVRLNSNHPIFIYQKYNRSREREIVIHNPYSLRSRPRLGGILIEQIIILFVWPGLAP